MRSHGFFLHAAVKRRWGWLLLFALLTVLLTGTVQMTARADAEQQLQQELEEYVEDNIDSLDLQELQRFVDQLEGDDVDVKAMLLGLIKGELSLGPRELLSAIGKSMLSTLTGSVPTMAAIVVVAVLFGMLFGLTDGFVGKQTNDIVYFVCYCAILLLVVTVVADVVGDVRRMTDRLVSLMNVVTPPLMTLMASVGGQASATLFRPQLALLSTLVANIISNVVLPLFIAAVVFAVVGNMSGNVRLDKLQSAVRYIIGCLLAVVFGAYTTYITVTGVVGGMADTVSLRAARYVIGSYIPLVGGYISQGFDLVTASVLLIKNALGVYALTAVVSVVLTPMLQLMMLTIGLKIVAGIIQPLGDARMASFVGGVADCMRSLLGAVCGIGFTFLVTMLLVMCSCTMVL